MLENFALAMLVMIVSPVGAFMMQVWLDSQAEHTFGEALRDLARSYRSYLMFYPPCAAFMVSWMTLGTGWEYLMDVYLISVGVTFLVAVFMRQPKAVPLSLGSFLAIGYMLNSTNLLRDRVNELV